MDDEIVLSSGDEEGENSCVEEDDSEDLLLNHRGASNRRKRSAEGKKTTTVAPSRASSAFTASKPAVAKTRDSANYCFESQSSKSRGGRMASQKNASTKSSSKTSMPSAVDAWIANQGKPLEGLESEVDDGYQPPLAGDGYW